MSLFSRLRIRTKILAAFLLVLTSTIALGLFSLRQLDAVDSAAAELRENWVPSVRAAQQLAGMSARVRQLQISYAMATSREERKVELGVLNGGIASFVKLMSEYAKLVSSPEEERLFSQVKELWATNLQLTSTYLAMVDMNDRENANSLFAGEMRDNYRQLDDRLNKDADLNMKGAEEASNRGAAISRFATNIVLAALGAVAVLCILVGVALTRGISGPITGITAAMLRLAENDLTVAIPGVGRGDEIGAMAGAIQVFKDSAIHARQMEQETAAAESRRAAEDERVRKQAEDAAAAEAAELVVGSIGLGLERLAQGDLTFRLDTKLPDAYETLRTDLNSAMMQMQDAMQGIVGSTGAIHAGSSEIAQASDDLSRRTEQQAASLEETAAALDEITATVRRAAEGAEQAQRVASETTEDAKRSGVVVQSTVQAMSEIEASARQISQIIGVIDEIAFQTNLLALNAGVEAARAGDAGRGFAVVASEVRALAQRSADAAKEIKALIQASSRQVDQGVKLVGETGVALGRIIDQVAQLDRAVTQIAAGAQEQATGLAQVNTAVNQMDQVTQQNAAMVEESTAASHALSQEATTLTGLTQRFQLDSGSVTKLPVRKNANRHSSGPQLALAEASD